jgi:23S rRNA (cytosine1962-C5)-methyltransferase
MDARGAAIAVGLWTGIGALALRRWGPPYAATHEHEVAVRTLRALALRQTLLPEVEAVRLIHAEADDLPGIFVDRYGKALVVQCSARAAEPLVEQVLTALQDAVQPTLVVQRNDGSMRDLEELPRVAEILRGGPSTITRFHEGDVALETDLLHGRKTGSYLDQRDNHLHMARLAMGACLDVFSHAGGFGLQMARRADHVVCVEQDPACAQQIDRNAALNGLQNRLQVMADNAFDVLRMLDESGRRFQSVVVDPPALAKRAGTLESALRGYFELNRRAIRLASHGACVMTFSCSARVTANNLLEVVQQAAADSRRTVQVLSRLHAGPDHPGLMGLPETEYLKGFLLRVV